MALSIIILIISDWFYYFFRMNYYLECPSCYFNKVRVVDYSVGEIFKCDDCGVDLEVAYVFQSLIEANESLKVLKADFRVKDLRKIFNEVIARQSLLGFHLGLILSKRANSIDEDWGE